MAIYGGLLLALASIFIGLAKAAYDNGGLCTFPYCGCITADSSDCIQVTSQTTTATTYSFTVSSTCDAPLPSKCTQDLYKVEFNSYPNCRWSKVSAHYEWQGRRYVIPTPRFDDDGMSKRCGSVQVLKLTNLDLDYKKIRQSPVTFTVTVDSQPGPRRCTTIASMFNSTATNPSFPFALFSSDQKCCPLPTPSSPPPFRTPPPSNVDFPRNCFPGNSAKNGGVGNGASTQGSAWLASFDAKGSEMTITARRNEDCDASLSGQARCCSAGLTKLEFAIQDQCRGAIASMTSTGPSTVKMPSYQKRGWPGQTPPNFPSELLIAKCSGLDDSGQSTQVTIKLRPDGPCSTVESFLYNGSFFYAVFGDTTATHSCCSTALLSS